ncbi:hypothetical protein NUACC21_80100 [Scytonema sp. NUACC21]
MEPIAIIGLGCRFPGAENPESFWQLLHNGVDAITEVPPERWDVNACYHPKPATPGKMNTRWGGFLEKVDCFDASFFGISPGEAERMDPQQRLVLEVAWESLENAGIAPSNLSGTQTGVFLGVANYDYSKLLAADYSRMTAYDATSNVLCITANRLSYILNLQGPSLAIGSACSSSLVALHYACRSLQSEESDLCLAGGVNLILSPEATMNCSQALMLAPDGRCKTFDASADGYTRGEGCGLVVLKRLSDAKKDGDNIQAIIRGSAVNQDGLSNGLTAPNGPSQQAVIRQALKNALVEPAQISYVEAHGTGTSLGDPIEMNSIKAVFLENRQQNKPCWVGSVKTNIGHLEAAAGISGLIKVVLSLKHEEIPPHLHLKQLNAYIKIENTPIAIPTEGQQWGREQQRFAGVSSFGFGGTNAHIIVEEAPAFPYLVRTIDRSRHILTLSAQSEQALGELAQRYRNFLASHADPEVLLGDICFTANTGRSHFHHRLAVVAESASQLCEKLSLAYSENTPQLIRGEVLNKKRLKIAFLFTGQGSQYINMGRELYEQAPTFRRTVDKCDEILRPYLGKSLLSILYPKSGETSLIDETAYTQPALFAIEYALAELWKSWGITPSTVMGHSVGEYVAACIAGVFSLEDGLKLIAQRGRLMQALPQNGKMIAVMASQSQVQAVLNDCGEKLTCLGEPSVGKPDKVVAIAAINGPQSLVISGEYQSIDTICAILAAQGIKTKPLQVSHAFHSPLMQPILAEFESVAGEITYSPPQIPFISNLTGKPATVEITTPRYWCEHLLQSVQFAASMEHLSEKEYRFFVEIGPKPILLGMGRNCLSALKTNSGETVHWLPSLQPGQSDWQQILQSLATLYVHGVKVNWSSFDQDYPRRRVELPTYPFQRRRYWVERGQQGNQTNGSLSPQLAQMPMLNLLHKGETEKIAQELAMTGELSEDEMQLLPKVMELLVKKHQEQLSASNINDWLYHLNWQAKPLNSSKKTIVTATGSWLIFADQEGVGQTLAKLLQHQGHSCLLIYAEEIYQNKGGGIWSLNPCQSEDFERLFQEAIEILKLPLQGVVHLWNLDVTLFNELTISTLEKTQAWGYASVLYLVQTLVKHKPLSSPKLWLVTRGVQPVKSEPSSLAVAQSSLWGLGRVVSLEHPQLWGGMVDLAPKGTADEVRMLLTAIENSPDTDHIAIREGKYYVAALAPRRLSKSSKVKIKSDSSYLITGGLGALGLKVAQWMVKQGARSLILTGRSAPSSEGQEAIAQMQQAGVKVLVAQADVSEQSDMLKVLKDLEGCMPPLGGIIHAAGVLDDGILLQQDWQRFLRVMAPKVKGAWNLHILTKDLPLDFFVVFSSAASLLGSPGQGNYAAANAFIDTLVYYRLFLGLPSLSINWGPWSDIGMTARLGSHYQNRMTGRGISSISSEQGLQVLEQLLGQVWGQVGVIPFDWSTLKRQSRTTPQWSLLSDLVRENGLQEEFKQVRTQTEFLQRLEQATASKRQELLLAHVQAQIAQVLGQEPSQLSTTQNVFEMGMDSLMAVDFKNRLEMSLNCSLPATLAIEFSTIKDITDYLVNEVFKWNQSVVYAERPLKEEEQRDRVLSKIEQLSDDRVEESLSEELAKLEILLRGQ